MINNNSQMGGVKVRLLLKTYSESFTVMTHSLKNLLYLLIMDLSLRTKHNIKVIQISLEITKMRIL